MNTEPEKDFSASEEAWRNIELCCQTLCDNQAVMGYIRKLEAENRWLREIVNTAAKY
jgi:hypothetical protein